MQAAVTKPYFRRVSWQVLFLRTLIVSASGGASALAVASEATSSATQPGAGALEEIVVSSVLLGSLLCVPTQAEGASRRKPPFGTSIQHQDPRWTRNCGKAQAC